MVLVPGCMYIHLDRALLYSVFKGPNTPTSRGCIRCVQWGGRLNSTTPFSLQWLIAAREMWDSWLSSISKTLLSGEQLTCSVKCSKHSTNRDFVIQPPEREPSPFVPGGAFIVIWSWKFTRGNIRQGGMLFPMALTIANIVTSSPLSCDTT